MWPCEQHERGNCGGPSNRFREHKHLTMAVATWIVGPRLTFKRTSCRCRMKIDPKPVVKSCLCHRNAKRIGLLVSGYTQTQSSKPRPRRPLLPAETMRLNQYEPGNGNYSSRLLRSRNRSMRSYFLSPSRDCFGGTLTRDFF